MEVPLHIRARDARDRLIDVLGIGETYPLRDLPVREDELTVPFEATATIPVPASQPGVTYALAEHDGPVDAATAVDGDGRTIQLVTPPVDEDITYDIVARKSATGREARLFVTPTIKVGLDTTLEAWIDSGDLLLAEGETASNASARLVHHATEVHVVISASQEGVDYHLVRRGPGADEEVALSGEVRGDLGDIVLVSEPMLEDTAIHIRAKKTFESGTDHEDQTELLDAVLPLRVRADPTVTVGVDPAPLIAYDGPAAIEIGGSQASASYRLHTRRVRDRDFVRDDLSATGVTRVSTAGIPDIGVLFPARSPTWTAPAGFAPRGERLQGDGATLRLELGAVTEDTAVVVEARKEHTLADDSVRSSSVPLAQAAVVLVRPDPQRRLQLTVRLGAETDGTMRVSDGEPGVYYSFRESAAGQDLGLPAYFHKRNEADAEENKGVGELAVEIDLAVARAPLAPAPAADLGRAAPEAPLVDTGPVAAGSTLHVHAVKAQTGAATASARQAEIRANVEVRPKDALIDHAGKATVVVVGSRADERYTLLLGGAPLGDARDGNGQDLSFDGGVLTTDAEFEIVASRPAETGHAVHRRALVSVALRPDQERTVVAAKTTVGENEETEVRIPNSQPSIAYRLFAAGSQIGEPVAGNGALIELPTGPLSTDTTFVVRASRTSLPDSTVELTHQASVAVTPGS